LSRLIKGYCYTGNLSVM